ncbi:MAG TPA: RNA polymerase sigma factor [Polyangiales bacterium]
MEAYLRYGSALVRKAERILRNRDDARDVVQALFVELLQRGETSFELPYLYRAVTNRCLNLLRDRSTHARLLKHSDAALVLPARTNCEDRVIELDLLFKLSHALDAEQLELLVYRYVDDFSQEEIAEVMGKSRKTIGKYLAAVETVVAGIAASEEGAP